jgi:hypothetical protein
MAKNVNGYGEKVHFIGVYGFSMRPEEAKESFVKGGAAAVLPTVNEIVELVK